MKQIQRNGLKFKVFEEEELRHCFNMTEKDIKIVLEYQDKFPELMLEDGQGFCVDARLLHSHLVKNVKIDKNTNKLKEGTVFSNWIKKRLSKFKFEENEDYIINYKIPSKPVIAYVTKFGNVVLSQEEIKNMNSQKRSYYGITEEYKITLDMAKQLCMIENNELGKLCRKYFISIERTLKDYKEWTRIREPEKEQANLLKDSIRRYLERNDGFDDTRYKSMKCKEFNMINSCLTGYEAIDLRKIHQCKDDITRDRLNIETNNAILELQKIDIMLIDSDMNFEMRKQFIKKNCENNYKHLYIK